MFNHGLFLLLKQVYPSIIYSLSFIFILFIEKEQARTMINSALQGLKESDRTANQSQQPVNLDSLSNFVEKYMKKILDKFLPIYSIQTKN
jgi:hypothetical protein